MRALRVGLAILCGAMLVSLTTWAQEEEDFLELAPELGPTLGPDASDFPRDSRRRISPPPPLPKDQDHPLLRRQGRSLIPWKELKETEFLSVRRWIAERAERDKDPLWKVKLRLSSQPEQLGKVISCVGSCVLHRGTVPNRVRWLSRVVEGDEITTGPDSYLWLMLTDGALVRLSPETSMAFLEMNVSKSKFFYHARLGQGHLYWLPRPGFEINTTGLAETDRIFLPLMEPSVNLEFFARQAYGSMTEVERQLGGLLDIHTTAQTRQHDATVVLTKQNNESITTYHQALIVMPNGSVRGTNVPMTFFSAPGGKSYFKFDKRPDQEGLLAEMFYRGYTNNEVVTPSPATWMEFAPDGRSIAVLENVPALLSASEILPKRIPTISLLRERWLSETRGLWENLKEPSKLAVNWGLRLWEDDIDKRAEFLLEYTRRVETTNLRALSRIQKVAAPDFDARYFSLAMDKYFSDIKRRHSYSNMAVLDMIPLHYYGWVLINGKQN